MIQDVTEGRAEMINTLPLTVGALAACRGTCSILEGGQDISDTFRNLSAQVQCLSGALELLHGSIIVSGARLPSQLTTDLEEFLRACTTLCCNDIVSFVYEVLDAGRIAEPYGGFWKKYLGLEIGLSTLEYAIKMAASMLDL